MSINNLALERIHNQGEQIVDLIEKITKKILIFYSIIENRIEQSKHFFLATKFMFRITMPICMLFFIVHMF